MKVRATLLGLGLAVFIFCSANLNRAALRLEPDPIDGIDFTAVPSEHPWQHDTAPKSGDGLDDASVHLVIFPVSATIKTIQLIRITPGIEGSGESAADESVPQRNK